MEQLERPLAKLLFPAPETDLEPRLLAPGGCGGEGQRPAVSERSLRLLLRRSETIPLSQLPNDSVQRWPLVLSTFDLLFHAKPPVLKGFFPPNYI
jgi:hypothetical protein